MSCTPRCAGAGGCAAAAGAWWITGRGRRRPGGEPDHECDGRCVPHRCQGASASAIHQVHAILHRAFAVAVKWRWMDRNPADLATRPTGARDDRDPPAPRDAVSLLEAAEAHRPDFALWLWLLLVTGTRRGELCAIGWSDIDFARQDLLIERAYAIRGGRRSSSRPRPLTGVFED